MNELIFVVEEAPEGGYTARALGESIFIEADTLDVLHDMVRDAVRCHYQEGQAPKIIRSSAPGRSSPTKYCRPTPSCGWRRRAQSGSGAGAVRAGTWDTRASRSYYVGSLVRMSG